MMEDGAMIYDIITACASGLDLLTVYLLVCGYTQAETAQLLGTSPPVVCRRIKRIENRLKNLENV